MKDCWTEIGIPPSELDEPSLRALLSEDIYQIRSPNDKFVIDIGWAYSTGGFVCRFVIDCDWDNPIDIFHTKELKEVDTWLKNTITKLEQLWAGFTQNNQITITKMENK